MYKSFLLKSLELQRKIYVTAMKLSIVIYSLPMKRQNQKLYDFLLSFHLKKKKKPERCSMPVLLTDLNFTKYN